MLLSPDLIRHFRGNPTDHLTEFAWFSSELMLEINIKLGKLQIFLHISSSTSINNIYVYITQLMFIINVLLLINVLTIILDEIN